MWGRMRKDKEIKKDEEGKNEDKAYEEGLLEVLYFAAVSLADDSSSSI